MAPTCIIWHNCHLSEYQCKLWQNWLNITMVRFQVTYRKGYTFFFACSSIHRKKKNGIVSKSNLMTNQAFQLHLMHTYHISIFPFRKVYSAEKWLGHKRKKIRNDCTSINWKSLKFIVQYIRNSKLFLYKSEYKCSRDTNWWWHRTGTIYNISSKLEQIQSKEPNTLFPTGKKSCTEKWDNIVG